MIIGIAIPYVMLPVVASACSMPTEADELCMIAVRTVPAKTPNRGFVNKSRMDVNASLLASGATASLIADMPNMSIKKPTSIEPRSRLRPLLENIITPMPITASIGAKDVGLSMLIHMLSPCMPVRLKIHAVTVVPILAPMIMPMACLSFIMPEFTNPTTITVVADEDCMIAVTPAPTSTPFRGLLVRFSSIRSSLLPDSFSRPPPITFIP